MIVGEFFVVVMVGDEGVFGEEVFEWYVCCVVVVVVCYDVCCFGVDFEVVEEGVC